jgi:hypothetical protein
MFLSALPLALTGVVGPLFDAKTVTLDTVVGQGQLLWPVVSLCGGSLWTLLTKHAKVQPPQSVAGLGVPAAGILVSSAWLIGHVGLINPHALPLLTSVSIYLLLAALLVGAATALVSEP